MKGFCILKVKNMCLIVSLAVVQTAFCMDPSDRMVKIEKWLDLLPFNDKIVAYVFDGFYENSSYQQNPDSPLRYAYIDNHYSPHKKGLSVYVRRFLKKGSEAMSLKLLELETGRKRKRSAWGEEKRSACFKEQPLQMRFVTFKEACEISRANHFDKAYFENWVLDGLLDHLLMKNLTVENKKRFLHNVLPSLHQFRLGKVDQDSPLSLLPTEILNHICLFVINDKLKKGGELGIHKHSSSSSSGWRPLACKN